MKKYVKEQGKGFLLQQVIGCREPLEGGAALVVRGGVFTGSEAR